MRRIFAVLCLLAFSVIAFAQGVKPPVTWKYEVKRISETEAELQFKATIQKDWHLYSMNNTGFELPLEFTFTPNANYKLDGKAKEPKPQSHYDSLMQITSLYFSKAATFTQKIKINSPDKTFKITGKLDGQACIDGRCTQVKEEFSFTVKPENANVAEELPASLEEETEEVAETEQVKVSTTAEVKQAPVATDEPKEEEKEESLLLFFLTSIGGGLLGLLMPCVFPMIPMTVSFFMKKGKQGKLHAAFYGLSIVIIFLLFGIVLSLVMGPNFANILSTHWIPNILFAVIFIIFAISLLGYFEITLPSSWVNKSAKNESKGGLLGVFFMALTLVLVSFSCTLPIAGAVALGAAGGSFFKPIIGMLGFSLGIAVPFTLFALFPGLLKMSPKSGSWMNTLKVILAFVELAFALKFLNVPDQTYHWRLLDREVYLAFWIVLFAMLGFYLLGKIRFPADEEYPVQKSWLRYIASIFVFTFVVYMIPGMFGAPLNAISGWLPPVETHDFDLHKVIREESGSTVELSEQPHYADKLTLPHGIQGYFDYDQALRVSKKENKPVFIDFTGHGCTNCRQVESAVWRDERVRKAFAEDFIVLSMYVDDKNVELLPEDYITDNKGNTIKMLGEKNSYISNNIYNENSQPAYFVIDSDGSVLVGPTYRELDIDKYLDFLNKGVAAYKEKHK